MRLTYDSLTGCKILLLVRNGSAGTFGKLLEALGGGADPEHYSLRYRVEEMVQSLAYAGLIDLGEGDRARFGMSIESPITLSPNWHRIQTALDISLSQFAEFVPGASLIVSPFFEHPRILADEKKSDIFVLMPFSDSLKPVYDDHIKEVAAQLSLSTKRADDFFTADSVMSDVWAAMNASRLVIADCTDRNANVFYEIGMAHTIGKPVILITQNAGDVPFDLRHIRYIEYQLTPRGMKDFEKKLKETVSTALAGYDW